MWDKWPTASPLWFTLAGRRTRRFEGRLGLCGLLAVPVPLVIIVVAAAVTEQRAGEPRDDLDGEAETGDEHAGFHVALEAGEQPATGSDHGEQDRDRNPAAERYKHPRRPGIRQAFSGSAATYVRELQERDPLPEPDRMPGVPRPRSIPRRARLACQRARHLHPPS
jgi:hypothetical protein